MERKKLYSNHFLKYLSFAIVMVLLVHCTCELLLAFRDGSTMFLHQCSVLQKLTVTSKGLSGPT